MLQICLHGDEAETWPWRYAPRQCHLMISGTWYQERKGKGGFYRHEAGWKYSDVKARL